MKKLYFFLVIVFLCCNATFAQLIGGSAYLQGQWLEIGELPSGAFGAPNAPVGYHPFLGYPSTILAEVYDYGHDGWTVGAPPYTGDYTYPGSPFEGWEIQVNGVRGQAFCCGGYTALIAGSVTSYTNVGGTAIGNWAGTAGGLTLTQETRVDTLSSCVVVTTVMKNGTGLAIPGVYYLRSCDPDNDEAHGGPFSTNNMVIYQNDWDHRVAVSAEGLVTHDSLILCTKDCRAVAFVYSSWSLGSTVDLATCWNKTYTPADYTLGSADNGDIAIGLVYNIGTINAGASAVISYAYVFNGITGVDDAFPDPVLSINGATITAYPDTFDACAFPTLDSVPLSIIFGSDKDWTWSEWTWTPSLGLSATTGVSIYADLTVIPGDMTYTVTGVDSNAYGYTCGMKQFVFTLKSCHSAWNNSPCLGNELMLGMRGDSTGATYYWWGPGGYTSTLHDPTRFPAVFSDSGLYHVVKTIAGVHDTDSTYVIIHPLPVVTVTDNSPLCSGMVDTLSLSVMPNVAGQTYSWTGPNGFTSTTEFPMVPGFTYLDAGTYSVTVTTAFGCVASGTVFADTIAQPDTPTIYDPTPYCQFNTFIPFTITGKLGAKFLWYTAATGGVGSPVPPVVNTTIVGYTTVWATQTIGSCESPHVPYTVHVITTPAAPVISGTEAYCQYIGPFAPLYVDTVSPASRPLWYTVATGGVGTLSEPPVNINVAGTYNFWVSQLDSTCESNRTPVTIIVHPKPAPPIIKPQWYCLNWPASTLEATPSETGDLMTWFGAGIPVGGTTSVPTPPTVAVGLIIDSVNEKSSFGCISDMAIDTVPIRPIPAVPVTRDTMYCSGTPGPALTADSTVGDQLRWYILGTRLPYAPVPSNNTPGDSTWYVSQFFNGCESDSTALTVTTIYTPVFSITARPWVCQFDSISLAYNGPALTAPKYTWSIPFGAYYADLNGEVKSLSTDSIIMVRFDSVVQNNYVNLLVSDNNGFCTGTANIRINIIPKPVATSYSKTDVCVGDTVTLALASKSPDASDFVWLVDNAPFGTSTALNIISTNSNSGGPFSISWNDSGRHVITVSTTTLEGCNSLPAFDTVDVHTVPDASFKVTTNSGSLCLEDSVLFSANTVNYNDAYTWTPAHFFNNVNKPVIWGMVEQAKSIVTLTVTDPFGCMASNSVEIDPGNCCTIGMPNAFSPDGDGKNDFFRPIFAGYHNFHIFRIANRWGQTVYESTNDKMEWDGTFNGVPQDIGVYYYYIKFDCGGTTFEQTGDVTLIR